MPTKSFAIYVPFNKVEQLDDGTLMVWGRATQEVLDSDREVCDYETSAPLFQRRSQMMKDMSGGENLFPLRAMHQPISAGKVVEMTYVDEEKAIDICAKVVDENEVKKVRERVYTGFSVGGNYARRWRDPVTQYMKFTADPREISLVDVPAVPTARLTLFKLEGIEEEMDTEEVVPAVAPDWVSDFIKSVNKLEELHKAEQDEKSSHESKLKALGERIGIARRDGSPLTAPKDYPDDANEYGDPANWAFPVDSSRASVAVGRFNGGVGAEQYSPRSRHVLGRRIARLASRFGVNYKYDPENRKIIHEKVGKTMTDITIDAELLKALTVSSSSALDSVDKDPSLAKDALHSLAAQVAQLANAGSPVGSNPGGPTLNTGAALKVDAPTETPKDKEEDAKDKMPPAAKSDVKDSSEYKEIAAKFEAQSAVNETLTKLLEQTTAVLAKFSAPVAPAPVVEEPVKKVNKTQVPPVESPLENLNSMLNKSVNKPADTDQEIVDALMGGGPYALVKALTIAGGDDANGALAWQRVNNAIRKATYDSLEKGGIITANRYAGRIYQPQN